MKTLVLMRHARTENSSAEIDDHARNLTPVGLRDATEIGNKFKALGLVPDAVLISSAARTQQTWACIAKAGGWDVEARVLDELYLAPPNTYRQMAARLPDTISTILYIGHSPGIERLARSLATGAEEAGDLDRLQQPYPPGGAAVISYDGAWPDLPNATGTLISYLQP